MMTTPTTDGLSAVWPPLPVAAWQDTYQTLHLWTQIIDKIRLALAPKLNHWWHATLYVTPRGLTTSSMPAGTRSLQITFDFLQQQLLIETSDGITRSIALAPRSVAAFYQAVMRNLREIGIEVQIWTYLRSRGCPTVLADSAAS
jgi:hypothetical protein